MGADRNNRLAVLAGEITTAVAAMRVSAEAMAERALEIGRALIEAKAAIPHGEWGGWLESHVQMSARSARRYMQLVRAGVETATVADLGIRAALEGPDQPPKYTPAEELVAFIRDHWSEEQIATFTAYLERTGEQGWLDFQLAVLERRWKQASEAARSRFREQIGQPVPSDGVPATMAR